MTEYLKRYQTETWVADLMNIGNRANYARIGNELHYRGTCVLCWSRSREWESIDRAQDRLDKQEPPSEVEEFEETLISGEF
jgi:hypothetical protein